MRLQAIRILFDTIVYSRILFVSAKPLSGRNIYRRSNMQGNINRYKPLLKCVNSAYGSLYRNVLHIVYIFQQGRIFVFPSVLLPFYFILLDDGPAELKHLEEYIVQNNNIY
jgi:hypothetical protein